MASAGSTGDRATFHWSAAADVLAELVHEHRFVLEDGERWFESTDGALRVHPPLVAPIPSECGGMHDYRASLPKRLGRHLVVLMQAGATSLGIFDEGEEVATKSFKRYVVRGKGRAQPTHLAAKGKSRYGSRLRLQNARALLDETSDRLCHWWREFGPPERIYVSAPARIWSALFDADPVPPFERETPVVRIPRDIPRPTTEVLILAYRSLCYGRIERIG